MKVGTFQKQPRERFFVSINYEKILDDNDAIAAIQSVEVSPAGELEALPILAPPERVRLFLQGGEDGKSYVVTVLVQTEFGERFEDELTCKVKEI